MKTSLELNSLISLKLHALLGILSQMYLIFLKHKTENLEITRFLKIHFIAIVLKSYMLYVVYKICNYYINNKVLKCKLTFILEYCEILKG